MFLILLCALAPFLFSANESSFEDYPLIKDARNYKNSSGGKGIKAQGIPLLTKTEGIIIGEKFLNLDDDTATKYPWRYLVTMNFKKTTTKKLAELATKLATQLLPSTECSRLAILIGINEKIKSTDDIDEVSFNWEELRNKREKLEALGVPILFIYTPWAAYRDGPQEEMTPEDIIRNIKHLSDNIKKQAESPKSTERQRKKLLQKIKKIEEDDDTHGFPFGGMRTHLLTNQYTNDFIRRFSKGLPVFLHIQDSDFTNLQTSPRFYNFGEPSAAAVVKSTTSYLYKKYDFLIRAMIKQNAVFPAIIGGAHVYDPAEDLDEISIDAKEWTRFASEMGNLIKHIIAVFQPYGVYFHEPNTMCIAPQTIQYIYDQKKVDLPIFLDRLQNSNVKFGMSCEVQEFTRDLFKGAQDKLCRGGMIFSAQVVLASSMKRSLDETPFNIRFGGSYDSASKKFRDWKRDDIVAIHGMPQEIIDPNAWMCNVTTSFSEHRTADRRTLVCELFSIFDPHALTGKKYAPSGFYETLVKYDEKVDEQKDEIKEAFQRLLAGYDKRGQGKLTAFYILSSAWEAGQAMRIMFLDYLQMPQMPARRNLKIPALADERKLIADRINYRLKNRSPFPNSYTVSLLDLDKVPRNITVNDMLVFLINLTHKYTNSPKKTAKIIGISEPTVKKILGTQVVSPQTRNKYKSRLEPEDIADEFPELPEPVRLEYAEAFE